MIRRLAPGDAGVLAAAWERLLGRPPSVEGARAFLSAPGTIAFAALDGEHAVGLAYGYELVRPEGRKVILFYSLDVAEAHRRRGIGRALTDAMLGAARSAGAASMWVQTDEGNESAQRTYEAAGGERIGSDVVFRWTLARG